jgi:hypothetical protein
MDALQLHKFLKLSHIHSPLIILLPSTIGSSWNCPTFIHHWSSYCPLLLEAPEMSCMVQSSRPKRQQVAVTLFMKQQLPMNNLIKLVSSAPGNSSSSDLLCTRHPQLSGPQRKQIPRLHTRVNPVRHVHGPLIFANTIKMYLILFATFFRGSAVALVWASRVVCCGNSWYYFKLFHAVHEECSGMCAGSLAHWCTLMSATMCNW